MKNIDPQKNIKTIENHRQKKPLKTVDNIKNPPQRFLWILPALALGGYLILTHRTLGHTLAGLSLWAIALFLLVPSFPEVPGVVFFSKTPLRDLGGKKEWNGAQIALAGSVILLLLEVSNFCIRHSAWWALLGSLLVSGGLLALLENHSPAFWTQTDKSSLGESPSVPWAGILILLVGSFFLFYGWDKLPIGRDFDSCYVMELASSFLSDNGRTTPYVDGWSLGNPSLPYFLMGLFFKLVGLSQSKGVLFLALCNLIGFLFFYGFLRFYLPKISALAATLLFSTSHWVIYFARETNAASLLLPFECASLFFFARALERGKTRDYAVFGTLLSCLLMVYPSGRAILAFFIVSLAVIVVFRFKSIYPQKASWALACGIFMLWYLPMIIYYQHTANPLALGAEEFARDSIWQGKKFFVPWDYIHTGLQMFTFRTTDVITEYLPRLSPWESLFLLAGFGWCLWNFFNPVFFTLICGFFLGLAPSILSNDPTLPWRALSSAPFVYLLVGIGLDRVGRVVAAPLGSRGGLVRLLLIGAFMAFSVGWQYDVFFHQLPKNRNAYWANWAHDAGQRYLMGKTTAQYMKGWDTYVDTVWGVNLQIPPDAGFSHSQAEIQSSIWDRIILRPDQSPLPLKKIPEKGAVILLHDETGRAFQDWIRFYYPDAKPKVILSPFGDVEIRLWEITPDQIRQALSLPPEPPPGGMVLSWFDSKNRRMGRWLIPTLSSKTLNDEWFSDYPGVEPPFPWKDVAYFILEGSLRDTDGSLLALETTGQAGGILNGRRFHLDGTGPLQRLEFKPITAGWVPFKIRYSPPKPGGFALDFYRHDPAGWDIVPSSELKP